MNNSQILKNLETQENDLLKSLQLNTISEMYGIMNEEIKSGDTVILNEDKYEILKELEILSADTSKDAAYKNKLNEYVELDDKVLINYFKNEMENIFDQLIKSNKIDTIKTLVIEYDDYYNASSEIICYNQIADPIMEEPYYFPDEFHSEHQSLYLQNGIDFGPAWINCEDLEELDYLEVNLEIESLFQFHSVVLLHKAIDALHKDGKINFITNRPFLFFINLHDHPVTPIYKISN